MRLSACFLSCLLSRPQTATALQRNTRPSTHDAPLPVYGQETVRPVTLSHYRAGKVSFFCLTPVENYNITIRQCTRTFGAWTSYFSCPKRTNPSSLFCAFQGIITVEFLRFYGPRRERKDLFHGQKRIFSCGTTAGNHERARCGHLARSSSQSK